MDDKHAYTNEELDERLRHVPHYLGCFAIDQLPKRLNPDESLIVNQDHADGDGTHWMAVAHKHGMTIVFDPFGGPTDPRIVALGRASVGKTYANTLQYQPASSHACGALSAYFIDRIQHHDPYVTLYKDLIPSTSKRNPQVALKWFHSQEGRSASVSEGGELKVLSQAHIGPRPSQQEQIHGLVEGIAEGAKAIKGGPGEFAKWAAQVIFNRMKGLHENTQLKNQIKMMWGPDGLKMYEERLKENPEYMPKEFIDEGAKKRGFDTYDEWWAAEQAKTKASGNKNTALFMRMRYGERAYKDFLRKIGVEYGKEPWRAEYEAIVARKGGKGMYRFGDEKGIPAPYENPTMRHKMPALSAAERVALGALRGQPHQRPAPAPAQMGTGSIVHYCLRCKHDEPMVGAHHLVSKNGMEMVKGKCAKCHAGMCRILGKAK